MNQIANRPTFVQWDLFDDLDEMSIDFQAAQPFAHVVLPSLLTAESEVLRDELDSLDGTIWTEYPHEFQRGKRICSDLARFPFNLQSLVLELSSPKFLQVLETLTGVDGLIPDPYLEGGGLHRSGGGGILRPHTDFHLYARLGLYRQINVLVYLNTQWDESWGGCLELYGSTGEEVRPAKTVIPEWGKCVIFRTNDRSVHGFSRPIQGEHHRQSLALYYYTSRDVTDFSGDYSTHWYRERPSGIRQRTKRHVHATVLKASRAVAVLAHRLDPDIDRGHHRD